MPPRRGSANNTKKFYSGRSGQNAGRGSPAWPRTRGPGRSTPSRRGSGRSPRPGRTAPSGCRRCSSAAAGRSRTARRRPPAPAPPWVPVCASSTRRTRSVPSGQRPEANCPPHHSTVTGCSFSHGSPAHASATVRSNAARASSTGSSRATPNRPSATSRSGTVDGPVAGPHGADLQGVRDVPAPHHGVDGPVAGRLQGPQHGEDQLELLHRADPAGAGAGVRGQAGHPQPEGERAAVGGQDVQRGRLGDHAGVGAPAAVSVA